MRDTSMNSVLSVLLDTHQPAVEPFEPLGWFFSMGNVVTTAFCFVQTLRMFLPLFMPPLFSVGSMLSVGMFLWRLWMANSGCCYCGLRWHVRFPVFNEVDMILSLKGFFRPYSVSVDSFHLARKCFGAGEAPEQQLPIPHNWGGGKSLAAGYWN